MSVMCRALIGAVLLWSVACTKAVPTLSTLDPSNLPQPTFSGRTDKSYLVTSSSDPLTVSGECDSKINSLQASAVGLSLGLGDMVLGSVTVACSANGTFSFQLKSLSALGFTITDNTAYEIDLRGVTRGGVSNSSVIRILYSSSGGAGPKGTKILSGSTASLPAGERLATSSSFKATVRINRFAAAVSSSANQADIKTSPSFQFKGGAAASGN